MRPPGYDRPLAGDSPDPLDLPGAYGPRPDQGRADDGPGYGGRADEGRGYGDRAYGGRDFGPAATDERTGDAAPFAAPFSAVDRSRRRQHWAGMILIVLGVLFLAQNFGLLWWIQARFIWPLVLVGIGAWLLFGRGRRG